MRNSYVYIWLFDRLTVKLPFEFFQVLLHGSWPVLVPPSKDVVNWRSGVPPLVLTNNPRHTAATQKFIEAQPEPEIQVFVQVNRAGQNSAAELTGVCCAGGANPWPLPGRLAMGMRLAPLQHHAAAAATRDQRGIPHFRVFGDAADFRNLTLSPGFHWWLLSWEMRETRGTPP